MTAMMTTAAMTTPTGGFEPPDDPMDTGEDETVGEVDEDAVADGWAGVFWLEVGWGSRFIGCPDQQVVGATG